MEVLYMKQRYVVKHDVDLCVIGGGLAGILTAVSAARCGIKVVLMQDRPVLGGFLLNSHVGLGCRRPGT